MPKRFEYLEIEKSGINTQRELQRLGQEGWELVGTISPVAPSIPTLYFKREIESPLTHR